MQKLFRVQQMFHDGPKCDGVKLRFCDIHVLERLTSYSHASTLSIIEGSACHIMAEHFVRFWVAGLKLIQESAGRTTHIQHLPSRAPGPKNSQLALEADGSIITFQFVG